MTETPGRREELIAAALAGELSDVEAAELDRLRAADPTIDRELAAFGVVLADLRALGDWDEAVPSEQLRSRILAVEEASPAASRTPRRGRIALAVGAAAAGLVLGAVAGPALFSLGDRPVEGPAGTLGAVETIAFDDRAAGIELDGSVVAHTWGTETILEGTGFTVGESYSLVLVTDTGERLASGSFLGSAVAIDCEMNAAVLRASVTAIEITDARGGAVAVAELPAVAS
ncbi:hypothetical protein SAMN06295885_0145 [Rathayibacter oskolensis]|uniref:Anti-sigma-K factor RskA n=1 Tax=Rathayibacter oskolensis TaxID=1891671 RepID=A0A1X7MVZ3_9MICO|nr:hypothetical protein [Rathayibacter oskolensis]SMH28321.1 hypothetical protein SAMN06295885_0145 [Rathayibacter oskolensis]